MKGKHAFLLFIVTLLISVLLACNDEDRSSDREEAATDEAVEIVVMTHYSAEQEQVLQEYIDVWNEENPSIQVKHNSVDFDQLLPTIMAQQTSGQHADILHLYSLWGGQLQASNVLADPPSETVEKIEEEFTPAAVLGATVEEQLLGYPTEVQTYGLFYNKTILEEAGYNSPPSTWDEFFEVSEAVMDVEGVKQGFGLTAGWDSAVVHPYLSMVYSAGGNFISEDGKTVELNSEAGLEALNMQKSFIDAGLTDTSINVLESFPDEETAMTINASWWLGSLAASMEDRFENVATAQIPAYDGENHGSISYGYFYGVNNRSNHQDEAWAFLEWLNTEVTENGATPSGNFLMANGIIPSHYGDMDALEEQIYTENNQPFIDALEYAVPESNFYEGQQVKTILQREIESLWTGQKSPEEALDDAKTLIENELN